MDFSRVCRTCLATESLKPIFAQTVDHRRYSTVIFISTGVKMELDDGLPQQMCVSCVSFINESLKFRRQCKDSEHTLLNTECLEESIYEVENISNDDLKIELKGEYRHIIDTELNIEIVRCYNDSDVENGKDSCIEKNSQKDEKCDVLQVKPQHEGLKKNGKMNDKKKNVQRVSCPVCYKQLSSRSLRAHLVTAHYDGLQCKYCKLDCPSKEALATHSAGCPRKRRIRSKSAKELVKCEECNKTMQRASLRAHVAVKHEGLGPVCEHCGRRFGNMLRLTEHLRARHGHAKLKCEQCGFTSASRLALENHERRHRGEKPYVCECCGAKFHAAYLLAQHRHSHRTERTVKCEQCGAAFKSSNGLHVHRRARHGAGHVRRRQGKVPPLEVAATPSEPS